MEKKKETPNEVILRVDTCHEKEIEDNSELNRVKVLDSYKWIGSLIYTSGFGIIKKIENEVEGKKLWIKKKGERRQFLKIFARE